MSQDIVKTHAQQPPKCPCCKDRGWFEGPTYDPSFGWSTSIIPCSCVMSEPLTKGEKAFFRFIGALFGLLILVQVLRSFGVIR